MARLNDTLRAALGYWWDLISGAAQQGLPVTDTVQMANDIAQQQGRSLSFAENGAISSLYGYARRIENAGNSFQTTDPSLGITADMIAVPPWARDEQEMNTFPVYHVRFEYQYLDSAGNQQTGYRTSVFDNGLADTIGDLTADVLDDAEAMAAKYGHTLLGVRPLTILAV